jgi:glycosyltransferase involved in cell wall biosynthesis
MNPTVSVCIPAYNAEAYLAELIEVIIGQTFSDWELIIVNNASTDSTAKILDKILVAHPDLRIKIVTNDHTLRMVDNFNAAIGYATGEFVKLICADDLPTKDCLERQVLALKNHPNVVMAAGSRIIINHHGKRLFRRSGIKKTGLYDGKKMIRRCILAGANIIGDPVCVMLRRSALQKLNGFDDSILYCFDMEYWFRILNLGDLFYDTTPVGFYRIHKKSAGTGLAGIAVEDIVKAAKLQAIRGSVQLSSSDLRKVRFNAWWTGRLRQLVYKILG